MAIEIKVLRKYGPVEPGKYKARLLPPDGSSVMFAKLSALPAQIISGPHAGIPVPYANYIQVKDLPAQSDVMLQNTKMVEKLAEVGRTVEKHIRTIDALGNEVNTLTDTKERLGKRIDELEKRNKELHEALDRASEYSSILRDSLEASIHANRVVVPKEEVEALRSQITILVNRWYFNPDSEAGSVGALVNHLCEFIQQHGDKKQPF